MLKTKKEWKNMEINRVRLNPEQAVLSCCCGAAGTASIVLFGSYNLSWWGCTSGSVSGTTRRCLCASLHTTWTSNCAGRVPGSTCGQGHHSNNS